MQPKPLRARWRKPPTRIRPWLAVQCSRFGVEEWPSAHVAQAGNVPFMHYPDRSRDSGIFEFSVFSKKTLHTSRAFSKVLQSLKNADAQALLRASFDRWRHPSGLPRNDVIGALMAPMASSHPQVEGGLSPERSCRLWSRPHVALS